MSERTGGPWTSSGAQISAPPHENPRVDGLAPAEPRTRLPEFPTEGAERGIAFVSRLAGPVVFFLALGGIVWFVVK